MPYIKPTLSQVITDVKNNLFSRIPSGEPSLRNSFLNVLAMVMGGALYGLYGALDFILKQQFPDQASAPYIDRWATIFGVLRGSATKATGTVKFTGTNGSTIPLGAQVARSDGILFTTLAIGTIVGGEADVAVACDSFGETGNTDAGAVFSLTQTYSGIDAEAVLQAPGAIGGAERDSDTDLQADTIERIRKPPRGGADYDFIFWTKEALPITTRVWVRVYGLISNPDSLLLGQVKIYFMADGIGTGFPTAPQVALVLAYLESKAEPTARLIVAAPVDDPIALTIDISPNTTETESDLNAALDDLFLEEASPGGTITLTKVIKAVSAINSIDDFDIVSPVADIVSSAGALATKGTVTVGTL